MTQAQWGDWKLRIPQEKDAVSIFHHYAQSPVVTRYLVWKPHQSLEETQTWVRHCMTVFDEQTNLKFVIATAQDEAVGMIGATVNGFQAVVGYVLAQEFWGQGVMTQALTLVADHLLSRPSVYRVYAQHDLDNPASGRVMQKAGLVFEGRLKRAALLPNVSDEPRDSLLWAKTK